MWYSLSVIIYVSSKNNQTGIKSWTTSKSKTYFFESFKQSVYWSTIAAKNFKRSNKTEKYNTQKNKWLLLTDALKNWCPENIEVFIKTLSTIIWRVLKYVCSKTWERPKERFIGWEMQYYTILNNIILF